MDLPLSREEFRNQALKRDNNKCVLCGRPADCVHHVMERRLFGKDENWGYILDNAASVCNECHKLCEMTLFSVEQIRGAVGITNIILPSRFYPCTRYDKWGNIILDNGKRLRGELFYDESVQEILERGGVLRDFIDYVKYPRTHHLPWSPGITKDDRVLYDLKFLTGEQVVVTVKMDGENTSLYRNYIHARSIDYGHHDSRSWVRRFHAERQHEIPEGWRIVGENVFAKHSIHYTDLDSFFYGFSVWDDKNRCLSWEETLEWFALLGIISVPIIYKGLFSVDALRGLSKDLDFEKQEGYVVRIPRSFSYGEFHKVVGKYVRPQHVKEENHWFFGKHIICNKLRGKC